jgi:drug/metabolite transporter (DMT)-like permease
LAWALLLLSPALFCVNMIVARVATFVPPNTLALGRWILMAAFLLPLVWPAIRANRAALRTEWRDLLILGGLGMWICGAFVYIGARTTEALNIGLIYAASPIVAVLVGRFAYGEALNAARIAGIVLCLAGVAAVFCKGDIEHLLAVRFTAGDIWIAIAAASWGVYSMLLKHRPSAFDPLARLCLMSAAGALILLPFAIREDMTAIVPWGDWRLWGLWLLTSTVPGVLAYGAYSFCVKELGAANSAISMYLGPPYVGIMAWFTLGEAPHWYHFLGIALVLPGLFLATRNAPKET